MSNVVNDYTFQNYNSNLSYSKNDVVYGVNASDNNFYYANQAVQGVSPWATVAYSGTAWERTDDLVTVYFTKTGTQPDFAPGTMIVVRSASQGSLDFTGMALEGGANYVRYLNPGWNQGFTSVASLATVRTELSPAWSTGFYWVPSNSSNVKFDLRRDYAQFGDGYSQQARMGINSVGSTINMTFENRDYKEAKAIINFVQVAGGVIPITVNLPVNRLFNNPKTKYLLTAPDVTMAAYNLNNVSVTATRVYNP